MIVRQFNLFPRVLLFLCDNLSEISFQRHRIKLDVTATFKNKREKHIETYKNFSELIDVNARHQLTNKSISANLLIAPLAANKLFSFSICDNMRTFNFMAEQTLPLKVKQKTSEILKQGDNCIRF